MKRPLLVSLLALSFATGSLATGCAGMSPTEQRTLSGGAIGAAGGALIGAAVGHPAAGAAIGGAAGATGGYVYGKSREQDDGYGYDDRDRDDYR
jgi:hypothetical protein